MIKRVFTERFALKMTAKIWGGISGVPDEELELNMVDTIKDTVAFDLDIVVVHSCPCCDYCRTNPDKYDPHDKDCSNCPLLDTWNGGYKQTATSRQFLFANCIDNELSPYKLTSDHDDEVEDRTVEELRKAAITIAADAQRGYNWWRNLQDMNQ